MVETQTDFTALLDRFSGLGRADRKAVLKSFSAEERVAFEAAVAAHYEAQAWEDARQSHADRQFLGYSAWLAELVEQAVKSDASRLAPEAARTLVIEHEALVAANDLAQHTGWRSVIHNLRNLLKPRGGQAL